MRTLPDEGKSRETENAVGTKVGPRERKLRRCGRGESPAGVIVPLRTVPISSYLVTKTSTRPGRHREQPEAGSVLTTAQFDATQTDL